MKTKLNKTFEHITMKTDVDSVLARVQAVLMAATQSEHFDDVISYFYCHIDDVVDAFLNDDEKAE